MRYVRKIEFKDRWDQYRLTPMEINDEIKKRNGDAAYAFSPRGPLDNGHFLLLKDTREHLVK
jgi:3'-phosphoadenosine 5'-phosphosulfate synthase